MPKYVRASDLVERYGFTPRHWIRMAAMGKIPGAHQPFGPHGRWVFDDAAIAKWWLSRQSERREPWTPAPRPRQGNTKWASSVPTKLDLKASLAIALGKMKKP